MHNTQRRRSLVAEKRKNKPGGGRVYKPRACNFCGGESVVAIQTRAYRLGRGTRFDRGMKFGGIILVCSNCSRSSEALGEALGETAGALLASYAPISKPRGPSLFAVNDSERTRRPEKLN
jgi:hypothetical protein